MVDAAVPRPVALQMYTFRNLEMDYRATLSLAAEIGFVGVEIGDLRGLEPAEVRRIVDALGLQVCAMSLPREGEVERSVHDLSIIGAESAMLTFPEAWFESHDAVRQSVERMHAVNEVCSRYGVRLLYHNHFWEFTRRLDGVPVFTVFLDELARDGLEAQFEIDVYWVQTAGMSPASLLRELGPAVKLVHVKDGPCTTTDPMTALGTGTVDVAGVLRANPAIEWHVVELDACATDIVQAVRQSYRYLVDSGLSTGRAGV